MNQISHCPVCKSSSTTLFLSREQVPVLQNLPMRDQDSAVHIARGDLNLKYCGDCGFTFNSSFDLTKISYDEDYDNTQTCSPSFQKYLDDLAHHLVTEKGVANCRIVEVGCGQGLFLKKLVEVEGSNNTGFGFDPAYRGPEVDADGRLTFVKTYYGPESTDIAADVVVCRHVIEHIADPVSLLQTIRQALVNSPNARVFFETPCVEWSLRHQVIWDFFYEHCSYWSVQALSTAFALAGFKVESVQHVFGEQYLWLEATLESDESPVNKDPGAIPALAQEFAGAEQTIKEAWASEIQDLSAKGGLALWGAGAKGVTLSNLVDAERSSISCVVDLNPVKQGHYIPGTGHPIVSCAALQDFAVNTAILMNPNYRKENLALLRELNLNVELIDLGDKAAHEVNH